MSWLAEGRSWARLESVVELCGGKDEGKWEEGAVALLVLMFRAGDSGFGVEDADEVSSAAEVLTPFRPFMTGTVASLLWEKASRV